MKQDFRHCNQCVINLEIIQCGALLCPNCGELYAPEDFPQFMELSQDMIDEINKEVFRRLVADINESTSGM